MRPTVHKTSGARFAFLKVDKGIFPDFVESASLGFSPNQET